MSKNLNFDRSLLSIIGRLLPAIYDVIPRQGSELGTPITRGSSWAALNPQPLPPLEIGTIAASEFLRAAWLADRLGGDQARLDADIDDWCPTYPKWPRRAPWWWSLPIRWPPIPDPEPHPNWFGAFYLGFAARLATAPTDRAALKGAIEKGISKALAGMESANG